MRLWLVSFMLILAFTACSPTETAVVPTAQGPVVPTRLIPTDVPTAAVTDTVAPTNTDTPDIPTGTPTDTPAPTNTDTPSSTEIAALPTETVPPTATTSPTPMPTETPTVPPTAALTATPVPTNTATATLTPTDLPTSTATLTTTFTATLTATPTATLTATPMPTASPTPGEAVIYRSATWMEPVTLAADVALDAPVTGTLDDDRPFALFPVTGTVGMVLDIALTRTSGDLDPFLIVLDPKGREIVRNDDATTESRDAEIRRLTLPENGSYVIVATRYGQTFGTTTGEFSLSVTTGTASEPALGMYSEVTGYDSQVTGTLDSATSQQIYTFRAVAGDVVTIQMSRTSGTLDPRLILTDNLGNMLEVNDDNLLTGSLDAAIQNFIMPRTGYYTLIAGRFTGSDSAGDYRLKLALNSQNSPDTLAVLDPINSRTIDERATSYVNYIVGDTVDSNGAEHMLQALLTFWLPPLDSASRDNALASATLQLTPCYVRGGGFDVFGDMTIYEDNYGRLSEARSITRPRTGARILGLQSSCAPLDLTSLVQDAYANGTARIQLRLLLRSHIENGTDDQVLMTPRLVLNFAD